MGTRKQDFGGGNGEQRKVLKGKGGGLLTKSENYSKNNLFRCPPGDLGP